MKKKLLLSFVAAVLSVASFAQNYVYTPDARLKVSSTVDDMANTTSTAGWNLGGTSEKSVVDIVSPENDAFTFQSATLADGELYATASISELGTYVVTFKISNSSTTFTSVAGTDQALNRIVFAARPDTRDGADITTTDGDTAVVSTSTFYVNAEEQSCAIAITVTKSEQNQLVFILNSLAEGTVVSDIKVVKADAVYDTRNFKKIIDYANLLLTIPEFAASETTPEFTELVGLVQEMYDAADNGEGQLDDESNVENILRTENKDGFLDQEDAWLATTSEDMATYLTGISTETLTGTTKINRGDTNALTKYFPNLQLDGGNWQHATNADYLFAAIQNGYTNSAVYTAYNTNLPKGKYFFYADVCNANTGKSSTYVYTYSLETTCKKFVGTDSVEFTLPATSDYTPVYQMGEITEDGAFRAGISWPGTSNGGAFFIKNVAVRYIGSGAADQVTRKTVFEGDFMAQYNAAVTNRNKTVAEIATPTNELKWGRDTLQKAEDKWAPFLKKPIEAGWLTSDITSIDQSIVYANDSKVASNDELTAWKVLQGVFTETDTVGMSQTLAQYPIVRGYQYALNYVTNLNKVITDTKDAIADAKETYADPMNADGDHDTFDAAIKAAEANYSSLLAATSDATISADSISFAGYQTVLAEAKAAFLKSAELKPIVNIDFSTGWSKITEEDPDDPTIVTTTGFEVAGVDGVGKAIFTSSQVQVDENGDPENTTGCYLYQLGKSGENEEILHMGNSNFYIPLSDIDPATDVVKVEFDAYYGQLNKGYFLCGLTNTQDNTLVNGTNCLGGFQLMCYNSSVGFNTIFAGEDGTLDNTLVQGVPSSKAGDNSNITEANRTHYAIVYDLKAKTVKASWEGKFTNGIAGSSKTGYETAMPALDDITPKAFVFGCTGYSYADARRMWMDNVVIYKYASAAPDPTPSVKGDVNGDGSVNIADVNAVISVMCGDNTFAATADVNGDGAVNIADVNAVITIMCGGE